jgi:sec-independent protein translocase protein TatC
MHEEISNKKKQRPPVEKEMSFWEHLEELRGHLIRSVAVLLILSIIAFINKKIIFDYVILAPKDPHFITNRFFCKVGELLSLNGLCMGDFNLSLQNINMSGQFMMHMYISIVAGLVVAAPYILWEFWRFVKPALHSKEKKYSRGAVLASSGLFISGVLFSYFVIVPLTINFFGTYQISESVVNQINLNSYISTIVSVTLATGLVFELPILVYFLTKIGILTPAFMKKSRKYMLVIVLTIAAIITPPDVFSQILVSFPLLGLYEASIWVSKKVYNKKQAELAG